MKLLVVETRNLWSAALRRWLPEGSPRLCETRSFAECSAELSRAPTSFVVAELTSSNALRLLPQLAQWRRQWPQSALAVVAARDMRPWGNLALEAGAMLVQFSPRNLSGLIAAISRHAARFPQPAGNFAGQLWSELPFDASQNNASHNRAH